MLSRPRRFNLDVQKKKGDVIIIATGKFQALKVLKESFDKDRHKPTLDILRYQPTFAYLNVYF
jgi:predicted NAD/FAD-binding protein